VEPTLPRPGVSFTLWTALSRQGGAGGGEVCRIPLKLVAKRGVSTAEEAEGRCFFFLEDRFNFWAALQENTHRRGYHTSRYAGAAFFLSPLCIKGPVINLFFSLHSVLWPFI
jgi:hypothetical protein